MHQIRLDVLWNKPSNVIILMCISFPHCFVQIVLLSFKVTSLNIHVHKCVFVLDIILCVSFQYVLLWHLLNLLQDNFMLARFGPLIMFLSSITRKGHQSSLFQGLQYYHMFLLYLVHYAILLILEELLQLLDIVGRACSPATSCSDCLSRPHPADVHAVVASIN